MSGKLEKLKIEVYPDGKLDSQAGDPTFISLFNPESITEQINIRYCSDAVIGSDGDNKTFAGTEPQKYSFEFMIDATGAAGYVEDRENYVEDQIKLFRHVAVDANTSLVPPRPNRLKISWGSFIKNVEFVSGSVDYLFFTPGGRPLRAVIKADFQTVEAKPETASSSTSTTVTMSESDSLPAMCQKLYGDPNLYLAVAAANGLTNFRAPLAGVEIDFPPISSLKG